MTIKEVQKTTTTIEKIYICDRCGNESDWLRTCCICGEKFCKKCVHGISHYDCDLTEKFPSYSGDHPLYRICVVCWNEGTHYRNSIQKIRNNAELDERTLWDEWRRVARTTDPKV